MTSKPKCTYSSIYKIANFDSNRERLKISFLIIKRKMLDKNLNKHPRGEKIQRSFKRYSASKFGNVL
jgi:hypothetical protein